MFPRRSGWRGPYIRVAKPFHTMSRGRCDGVIRPALSSGGLFFHFENHWEPWLLLRPVSDRRPYVNTNLGQGPILAHVVVRDYLTSISADKNLLYKCPSCKYIVITTPYPPPTYEHRCVYSVVRTRRPRTPLPYHMAPFPQRWRGWVWGGHGDDVVLLEHNWRGSLG